MRYASPILLSVLILSSCGGASPQQQRDTFATVGAGLTMPVTYAITGTAKQASLTYTNVTGATEQIDVRLPWALKFEAKSGAFLYLSGQNKGEIGSVACKVMSGSRTVQEGTSTSAYGIASCSGSA